MRIINAETDNVLSPVWGTPYDNFRPPGPERRWLALQFCELTGKEMEYVPLSRDTTEADIKQVNKLGRLSDAGNHSIGT